MGDPVYRVATDPSAEAQFAIVDAVADSPAALVIIFLILAALFIGIAWRVRRGR